MNRFAEMEAAMGLHRLSDGSYADVRIDGADVESLLDVAWAASETDVCPCCDCLRKFGHEPGCTLGALLMEVPR